MQSNTTTRTGRINVLAVLDGRFLPAQRVEVRVGNELERVNDYTLVDDHVDGVKRISGSFDTPRDPCCRDSQVYDELRIYDGTREVIIENLVISLSANLSLQNSTVTFEGNRITTNEKFL